MSSKQQAVSSRLSLRLIRLWRKLAESSKQQTAANSQQ